MGEGFPADGLAVPERPVPELLHFGDDLALDRGRLSGERTYEDADPARLDCTEALETHYHLQDRGSVLRAHVCRAADTRFVDVLRAAPA